MTTPSNISRKAILCLSGWAQNPLSLQELLSKYTKDFQVIYFDYSKYSNEGDCLFALKNLLINPKIIIGWSLGGQIAARVIAHKIFSPDLFISISTPFQFVKSPRIPAAMPVASFNSFRESFASNSLKTLEKFSLLMMLGNSQNSRELSKNLQIKDGSYDNLISWLDYLGKFSCHDLNFQDFPRSIFFHGKQDLVVNFVQGEVFLKYIENSRLEIIDNCAHCPHISHTQFLQKIISLEISNFLIK